MLKERHAENESFSPARALNMVCIVDKAWSGEIANRLRHVGRYHASRTIVLRGRAQARRTLDAVATIASDVHPQGRRVRAAARDGDRRRRRAAPRARSTRSSTRSSSPTCRPCCGRRTATREAVDVLLDAGAGGAAGLGRRPRPPRRRSSARASCCDEGLRRRPRVAALDAVARARGGDLRPARTCAPTCATSARSPCATTPSRRPPRCCSSAGWPRAWAGSRRKLIPRNGVAGGPGPRQAPGRRRCAWSPRPTQSVRGLAGLTLETASGRHFELDRGPGGLRARYRNRKGDERELDRARRLARRGRASSARASARRCCATRPTGRRSTPPTRWRRERCDQANGRTGSLPSHASDAA